MKKDIHPKYFSQAKVTCACGNSFTAGSTQEKIKIEICSACHPLSTGEEKIIDTAGRVERFKARSATAKAMADKQAKVTKKQTSTNTKNTKKSKHFVLWQKNRFFYNTVYNLLYE